MGYPPATAAPGTDLIDPGVPKKKKRRSRRELDEFLELARDRFKQAEEADSAQRERELADLAFFAGDQWDADTLTRRKAQPAIGGMPPVPARPSFVINKQREPVRQVLNQERQADLGIELVAADDFGDLATPVDEAELKLREGLVRRIQRDSQAADARTWAFARAVQAGRGYYLVMTRYLPGKTWDQEVYVQRLYNQASVSLDPAHEQPDGSDAEWGFVGRDMPWEEYKATYPKLVDDDGKRRKNDTADANSDEFRALGEAYPGWFTADGETRSCRVVDYYYTHRETRTLAVLEDGSVHWDNELPEGAEPVDTREVIEKTICWAQLDGTQILDETDWPGPDLPIVKVVGEELQPYDDERRYEGMVRPSRHSQQGFNAMVSKWVETVGLAPIPPFQVAEGQVEGYEAWYQAANTRTLPYLPFKQTDLEGRPAGPPMRTPVDTPIQAIAGSVQLFDQAIQSTMAVHDPSMGRVDPSLKSGKAINAIVQQDQQGTSHYLDNLQRSIRYEAQIINNLLYPIYNRPGRIARILNGQGEPETVMLHKPSTTLGGRPVEATGAATATAKTYTLTKDAHFNVIVKITKSALSRRQQESEIVGQLISSDPNLMGVFGDLFFKNLDGPGAPQMAERAKAMLVPPVQALLASQAEGGAPPDPKLQAMQQQMQQMQQALQEAQQQLQTDSVKAQAALQGKQVDAQAALQKAQLDADQALKLQQMKNATALAVARIEAEKDVQLQQQRTQEEAMALNLKFEHAVALQDRDHAHAKTVAEMNARAKAQAVKKIDMKRDDTGAVTGAEVSEGAI